MFDLIRALYRAWQAGEIIRNPAKWKSGGELTAEITAFVAATFTVLLYFFPSIKEYLTTEMATLVGTIIITVLGIIQIIIGRITTKKEVGLNVLMEESKEPKFGNTKDPQRRDSDK